MLNLKLKNLTQTCFACPSQWEAQDENDLPVYIRFRWGGLTVRRALTPDGNVFDGEILFDEDISDPLDGCMTEEEMLEKIGSQKI